MEALECIETRRSIRNFKDTKIPHEVIEKIVKEASFAPSWKNTQVVRYTIIEDAKIKEEIANSAVLGFSYNTGTITKAAALVVVTIVHGRSGYEKDGSATTIRMTDGKFLMQVLQLRPSALQHMTWVSVL